MRVGFPHLGQSVDFVVSITFLRSPVFAIFAIGRVFLLRWVSLHSRATECARLQRRGHVQPFNAMELRVKRDCAEGAGLAVFSLQESRRTLQFGWLLPGGWVVPGF